MASLTAAAARSGDGAPGSGLQRGIAVPCFGDDPMELVRLGIAAEAAGFDGFFLWDHIVFSNTGEGPPIVDPWLVLAVVAASTSRIRIGTMITPVPRRRPWQLAKETTTLDLLSNGRLILGVAFALGLVATLAPHTPAVLAAGPAIVIVQADEGVPHGTVVQVMELAKGAGLGQLAIGVREPQ